MRRFTSSIFGDLPEPKSFADLNELLYQPINSDDFLTRMWRGQSSIEWRIDSGAYRRVKSEATRRAYSFDRSPEEEVCFYEKSLLKQARHRGYGNLNGLVLSDFELLALLQHNGAATRLVDFSRNALVALWFCISTNRNLTGLLVGCHTRFLDGYESQREERRYDEILDAIKTYDYPTTWQPSSTSPRIVAQHSQFLYSAVSDSKKGSLKLDQDDDATLLIAITPQLKEESSRILNQVFDIREVTLFPDVNGFSVANSAARPMSEMWRW